MAKEEEKKKTVALLRRREEDIERLEKENSLLKEAN
jgi:hypothetical protein